MKTSIKTFACAIVISVAFLACKNSDTGDIEQGAFCENPQSKGEGIPAMDCRVVAYKKSGTIDAIITDKNILKLLFPHIFENENTKCNYFAIAPSTSSYSYHILSQDMVLYRVHSTLDSDLGCLETTIPKTDIMLICDDTAEGNLKDKIDFDSIINYPDPDWDCATGEGGPNWDEVYF